MAKYGCFIHAEQKSCEILLLKRILIVILSRVGKLFCKNKLCIWSRAECVRSKREHITSQSSGSHDVKASDDIPSQIKNCIPLLKCVVQVISHIDRGSYLFFVSLLNDET